LIIYFALFKAACNSGEKCYYELNKQIINKNKQPKRAVFIIKKSNLRIRRIYE